MRLELSLQQKGVLLVVLPLTTQLIFLSGFWYLQREAEDVAAKAAYASAISENVNQLIKDFLENLPRWEWNSESNPQLDADYWSVKSDMDAILKRLKELIRTNPQQITDLDELEQIAHESMTLLEEHRSHLDAQLTNDELERRKHNFKRLKDHARDLVTEKLIPIASRQRQILLASPQLQMQNREQTRNLLLLALCANLIIAGGLASFYNRDIVKRLSTIFDNNLRLASRLPLNACSTGSDEIARLDQIFHNLARALNEAAKKELLVVENARDLICSLDGKGVFLTVSPASAAMLGYTPEELIGSKIVQLIFDEDRASAQNNLKLLMDGEPIPPFETRLKRKDASIVDTLWSARWSPAETAMFCVLHDITERKNAERLRQEVLQMVSHDLRTPLTAIRGILELVSSGMVGQLTDRGKQMIEMADQSSIRMLSLIKDLLEIEKMEAGMLELHKSESSLSDIFNQSIATVAPLARERKVTLEAENTNGQIFADSDRIVQILVNLLSNAIKFSPMNSTVTVFERTTPECIEITVADQGRGIPQSLLTTIFDRFRQVQQSDSKKEGGSGLGLAICKALVELHGGEIFVSSEEGTGSRFSFRIPTNPS
jgi:PAS domain S-box-containing protein